MAHVDDPTFEVGKRYLFRTSAKYLFGTVTILTDTEIVISSASLFLPDAAVDVFLSKGELQAGKSIYRRVILTRALIALAVEVPEVK